MGEGMKGIRWKNISNQGRQTFIIVPRRGNLEWAQISQYLVWSLYSRHFPARIVIRKNVKTNLDSSTIALDG